MTTTIHTRWWVRCINFVHAWSLSILWMFGCLANYFGEPLDSLVTLDGDGVPQTLQRLWG